MTEQDYKAARLHQLNSEMKLRTFEVRLKKYSEFTDWLMYNRADHLNGEIMCTKKGWFECLSSDWVQREETGKIEMLYTFESWENNKHVKVWFDDLFDRYKEKELVFCPWGIYI